MLQVKQEPISEWLPGLKAISPHAHLLIAVRLETSAPSQREARVSKVFHEHPRTKWASLAIDSGPACSCRKSTEPEGLNGGHGNMLPTLRKSTETCLVVALAPPGSPSPGRTENRSAG